MKSNMRITNKLRGRKPAGARGSSATFTDKLVGPLLGAVLAAIGFSVLQIVIAKNDWDRIPQKFPSPKIALIKVNADTDKFEEIWKLLDSSLDRSDAAKTLVPPPSTPLNNSDDIIKSMNKIGDFTLKIHSEIGTLSGIQKDVTPTSYELASGMIEKLKIELQVWDTANGYLYSRLHHFKPSDTGKLYVLFADNRDKLIESFDSLISRQKASINRAKIERQEAIENRSAMYTEIAISRRTIRIYSIATGLLGIVAVGLIFVSVRSSKGDA
jgi:hypothetical protein